MPLGAYIDLIKQHRPRVVVLYHGGEPLLHPDLAAMVRIATLHGVTKTQVVTNSSLLTADIAQGLIDAGLDELHTSFDGTSASENDAIRRGGHFDKDSANVRRFCDLWRKDGRGGRILIANAQLSGGAAVEVPKYLIDAFHGCGVEFLASPAFLWPGMDGHNNSRRKLATPTQPLPTYCPQLWETITVLSTGDVVPCCYDILGEMVLGNAFGGGLARVLSGAHREMRERFERQDYPDLCRRCPAIAPVWLEKIPAKTPCAPGAERKT
jgi:sulfatase maturation enzyme AslB (radical SAM superfamily)